MAAINQTTICNITLARITQGRIQNISELNSNGAEFCKLFYDQTRRYLLRRFNWNFSKATIALGQTTTEPLGWEYEYQMPANTLRVRHLSPEVGNGLTSEFRNGELVYSPSASASSLVPYEILGDKIHTNLESAYCIYSIDVTNEALFEPMFVDTFTWRLAFEVSMPLTGKHAIRDKMFKSYQQSLLEASAVAANEIKSQRPDPANQSDILRARQ